MITPPHLFFDNILSLVEGSVDFAYDEEERYQDAERT